MEKRILGWTTFSQSYHRGYCNLCKTGKTAVLVASNVVLEDTENTMVRHMEAEHGIRAAVFCGKVYENKIGRPKKYNDMFDKLPVDNNVKTAMAAKAKELKISIPDARREAYRLFLDPINNNHHKGDSMKKQTTISKINEILKSTIDSCGTADYTGVPRGTIVNLSYADDAEEIKFLLRHGIICDAGDRLVMAY